MASQAELLADRFEQANKDFIATIEGTTPEQWARTCADVGWPVGVTAHHVAVSTGALAGLVRAMAAGQSPSLSPEELDRMNAEHAQTAANCTRDETVEIARTTGADAAEALRSLTDRQLTNTADMGHGPMTLQQVIEMIVIGHPGMHLAGIRAALGK